VYSRAARVPNIGRIEGANLIKLSRLEPRIFYLTYPNFEADLHLALMHSLSVHVQTFRVEPVTIRISETRRSSNARRLSCR
jgi:hypothetical protein